MVEHTENDYICQLCKVEKLYFEPRPIYCSPCVARIKWNASYYTDATTETCHNFCILFLCYNEAHSSTIQVECTQFPKAKLHTWIYVVLSVTNHKCERWKHQICSLLNFKRGDSKETEYTCPKCCVWEIEQGLRMPLPQNAILGAKSFYKGRVYVILVVSKM